MYLKKIDPTPEQRKIFFLDPNKPVLLSGRAGSGKTTTAILRAAQLVSFYRRQGIKKPRVGFFVYNNTLKTYLETLAELELSSDNYGVWTLDYWCKRFLEDRGLLPESIASEDECKRSLREAIKAVGIGTRQPQLVNLGKEFLIEEVHYLLGRFGLDTARYIRSERVGRGANPEITGLMKRAIAEEIVPNYQLDLESRGIINWNLLHDRVLTYLRTGISIDRFDIMVVDEAQDLSALQIQIVLELISPQTKAITFIKDGTQRIYKANYIWDDVILSFDNRTQLELEKNYRNTRQIALAAASLMQSENEDNDISILDPEMIVSAGPEPVWARGRYSDQLAYLENRLSTIDIQNETVAILHIQNSSLVQLSARLTNSGYTCTVLQQDYIARYPTHGIFLSTLHSAKGLEFDHIFIIGYDDFFAPGPHSLSHRETSAHISAHRKLLYTAMSRARKALTITSSTDQYSRFLDEIDPWLLDIINL
jgi:DNA helicase IV